MVVSTPLNNIGQLGLSFPIWREKTVLQTTNQQVYCTTTCGLKLKGWFVIAPQLTSLFFGYVRKKGSIKIWAHLKMMDFQSEIVVSMKTMLTFN